MGVRGLTSYIARNAERYLRPHELHDCDLVIDGDNLACNLYKDASNCNSAFGGDYDEYYRTVINFFELLAQCNIRPFVLLDGGYEAKKIKTVERRLRTKIGLVKYLNPAYSKPIFPLMMREVFVDAVRDCGVRIMRCLFEADDEIAVLAKKLKCPVLSYDSDFYIHDVMYIPLITLTYKVYTKDVEAEKVEQVLRRSNSKKVIKKRKALKKALLQTQHEYEGSNAILHKTKTVKYLDCCIYTIENLLKAGSLQSEMLPIFAALIGNDYIDRSSFQKFFSQVGQRGTNKKISRQQRRIIVIMKWLQHETKDSALQKIVNRMKKEDRSKLLSQIKDATEGYCREYSNAFEFFDLKNENIVRLEPHSRDESVYNQGGGLTYRDHESEIDVSEDSLVEDSSSEAETEDSDITLSDKDMEKRELSNCFLKDISLDWQIPDWFRDKYQCAELPRFFVDLVHLSLYINNPQIEYIAYDDCNEISIDILRYIFFLLKPNSLSLRYLSRLAQSTNVQYTKLLPLEIYSSFDPKIPDTLGFKKIFLRLSEYLRTSGFKTYPSINDIFDALEDVPENIRLYLLAIVYWAIKSKHGDAYHLHALIICLVALSIIDSKVEPIRDEKSFKKKFSKIIQNSKNIKAEEKNCAKYVKQQAKAEKIKELLDNVPTPERIKYISKNDCILVQENLLKYYHLHDKFRKRHNDFSSQILHGFSEFQSTAFHLYSLNILFNSPFESFRMSQFYNGVFLYNMYVNLRERTDVDYYIENYIFQSSPIILEFYKYLMEWCKRFFPCFKYGETWGFTKENKKKKSVVRANRENLISDMLDSTSDSSEVKDILSTLKI